jgi:hypothetical protein
MVCIIDDREDVWNYARNLVCVKPYVYFKNTGDINDPHAAASNGKRKRKLQQPPSSSSSATPSSSGAKLDLNENNNQESGCVSVDEDSNSSTEGRTKPAEKANGSSLPIHEDTDDYLGYLERILRKVHDEYYRIYEERLKTRNIPPEEINEADLPDVKKVLPMIKSKILENCVITFSGVIPTGFDLKKQRCYLMATSLGAKVNENLVLANEDEEDSSDVVKKDKSEADKNDKYVYKYDEDDDSRSNSSGADSKSDDSSSNGRSNKNKDGGHVEANLEKKASSASEAAVTKDETKPLVRYTTHLVAVSIKKYLSNPVTRNIKKYLTANSRLFQFSFYSNFDQYLKIYKNLILL